MALPNPDHIFTIVPSDTEVSPMTQYIMVTVGGDLAVETRSGDTGVLPGLLPGVQYAISVRKVLATGTTASGIVGLI